MEAASFISTTHIAALPSTLVTSFVTGGGGVLSGSRGESDILSNQPPLRQVRDGQTTSNPVVIVGNYLFVSLYGLVTAIDLLPHHTSQGVSPSIPGPLISIPAISTPAELAQTYRIPLVTSIPVPNAAPQLGSELAGNGPAGPCSVNTAPLDRQQSSYDNCQRTIAPGGICCIPGLPDPLAHPSITAASTPASALASSSSTQPPSPIKTSSPSTTTANPPTSPNPPSTSLPPPSSAAASTLTPEPTEVIPPAQKPPILPILIPCALAAIGIVAFGVWYTVWRSGRQRHPAPPPVATAPREVDGQKVFEAGNFAGAEAFHQGIEEMSRKEGKGGAGEGSRGWKAGGVS